LPRIRSSRQRSVSAARWLLLFGLLVPASSYGKGVAPIDFDLKNWDGEAVTMEKLQGQAVVLTFSYAFCSVSCPIITGRLKTLDEAMNSPGKVVYLHVSIDPEMDTPERRKDYFNLYGIDAVSDNRWMFLSGDRDQLEKLWEFYEVEIEKTENPMLPEGYFMKYSPRVVVIGKDGTIKRKTDFYFPEEDLAAFVKGLL
jgi:cytochrome oxidase Cu insertion factor (SCO1/SenC/PrrC family)